MRDKLITVTVILLFALLLAAVAPRVNALAAEMGKGGKVIECAAGYKLEQLPDGGARISGMCAVVRSDSEDGGPVRPDGQPETGPSYDYAYPVPDEPYPYIDNPCDRDWYMGEECNP